MKRITLLIATFLIILSGFAQDKTGSIDKGDSYIDLSFTAADTLNESETYWVQITSKQDFSSMQDIYVDIDSVSGGPGVTIALYGRLTTSSSWTAVGDSVVWAGTVDTTFTMSFTTPNRYRYYKLSFRSDATDQQSLISDVQFKQWFSGGAVSGSSITDGTATLTAGALSGVTTITLENGATWDNSVNNVLEWNENSDELKWTFGSNTVTASSGDVTTFDYGTINLATDALDLSEGDIGNVGTITLDGLTADNTNLAINSPISTDLDLVADGDTIKLQAYQDGNMIDVEVDNTSVFTVDSSGIMQGGFKFSTPVTNTDGSETLTVSQSGKFIICTAAGGATTITIPDASASTVGVIYYLLQTADQNLVLTATTADNNSIVCDGVATSDNVTISTADHKIGAGMIVIGITATQWYVGGLNPESLLTPEAAD